LQHVFYRPGWYPLQRMPARLFYQNRDRNRYRDRYRVFPFVVSLSNHDRAKDFSPCLRIKRQILSGISIAIPIANVVPRGTLQLARHRTPALRIPRAAPERTAFTFALAGYSQSHDLAAHRANRKLFIGPIRLIRRIQSMFRKRPPGKDKQAVQKPPDARRTKS
jgi:hypothetical protein